jgi:hypothetical protein
MGLRCAMIAAVLWSAVTARAGDILVEDIFGRRLNEHGLTLVDWEGPIANPAIKVFVVPPEGVALPASAVLTSTQPRVYFNLPSKVGPRGPSKTLTFNTREKQPVFVSIFPDREAKNLDFTLQLNFKDAAGKKRTLKIPCHVIDQDKLPGDDATTSTFPIDVDFSQDRSDFFNDQKKRRLVQQAVHDWAYFLAPVPRDPVRVGAEKTFIWDPDGFKHGHDVTNAREYSGYLLYAYGIHGPELRSGGEASLHGGFQRENGKDQAVRRSGGYEAETRGNYNTLGWLISAAGRDYWKATNLRKVPNDLLSIAHHEIGHALFFSSGNTRFAEAQRAGRLDDAAVRDYLGADPKIDKSAHFAGSIDPASRCGAFGNEYHGDVPFMRWQITKLDLLCAQAVGYKLRETSAFVRLTITSVSLPGGTVGKAYKGKIDAVGGIPFYRWDVATGALPVGLELDSFAGALRGTPKSAGVSQFTIRVRDYVEKSRGQTRKLRIEIARPKSAAVAR